MAADDDKKDREEISRASTTSLEPIDAAPEGTCAFAPEPPPSAPGETTGEFPYVPATAAPAGAGTLVDPRQDAPPSAGDATGEFHYVPATDAPAGAGTLDCTVDPVPERDAPPSAGDATGEFSPDRPTRVGQPIGTTDFVIGGAVEALGRQTSLRPSGAVTQPVGTAAGEAPRSAGRYRLQKFHAKGGMGEVWLAEDSDLGRPVALKRMLKGLERHRLGFVKEAQVTGQLEHPGIIPVHELSVDDAGQPFYIMKFVHGQTLKEVIKAYHRQAGNADTPREVQWLRLLNVFIDLCQTIAYAHSRGVIHRDIKPDNVMVGAYGETLVLDWGLAKVIGEPEDPGTHGSIRTSDDVAGSVAGSVKGTPFYFAPEVAEGSERVDQLSDVYLLGATLYFLIANRTPREGKKLEQLLEDARTKTPLPPRHFDPTVSKQLDAICRKAMAHRKEDRYESASALAEDMQRYLAGEPVTAYRENLLERTLRWVKLHRKALARSAAAAVVLAGVATALILIRNADIDRANAVALADKLTGEDAARQEIKNFRARMEEARYYAASANPVAENVAALDAMLAESKAKEALRIADAWGSDLDKMPLESERAGLKKDIYDMLLEIAQLKSQQDPPGAQAYLARAIGLRTPTQSYHRLRARGLDAEGKKADAALEARKATDALTPATALDHYLAGEQNRIESLKQASRRELLAKAMEHYRQALKLDANHYWSHWQLGACYNGLGKHAEAVEALGACIVLQPSAPWGFGSRGLALLNIDDRLAEAEADLNHAVELKPDFRPARLHRAEYYVKRKQYDKAEADFAAVLAPPDDQRLPQAYLARGQMNMALRKYPEALADYQKAVADKLPIGTAYLHMARMYLVEKKTKQALESLTSFSKFDKNGENSPLAFEARGRELRLLAAEFRQEEARRWRQETYTLALSQLEEAVKRGGKTASLYDELGSTNEKLAEMLARTHPKEAGHAIRQAAAAYASGIKLAPEDPKLRLKRGWLLVNYLNDNAKAKDDFKVVIAREPGNAEAHAGLGYAAAMLKTPDDALVHADLAMLHGAGDYLVVHNVACIYAALIDTDPKFARRYQDQALTQITHAVDLWLKGGKTGPNEIELIENESAFPAALKNRSEFKKLVTKKSL